MDPVLQVNNLEVVYHTRQGRLQALHEVGFEIRPGEIVGIVGESGCGKSTIASAILRLLPPNGEITSGQIVLKGRSLLEYSQEELRRLRGRDISMVFQDPMTSLNPVFTIGEQMIDVQKAHLEAPAPQEELRQRAIDLLRRAGVPDPEQRIDHYPHQFSGGLRQRIVIAMALLAHPAVLIADEPTSALDVTMEAQILELMKELRRDYQTAILFVSHDLGVIAHLCDRVVVMYAGRVVEQGDIFSLYREPRHPYTRALLSAVPSRLQQGKRLETIPGRVPSLSALPEGCKFSPRCAFAQSVCRREPQLFPSPGSHPGQVRCWAYGPADAPVEGFSLTRPPVPSAGSEDRRIQAGAPAVTPTGSAATPSAAPVLVQVEGLSTHFAEKRSLLDWLRRRPPRPVQAVEQVNLEIRAGEVIGLVGESGCGKTTLGKTILGLIPASEGRVCYQGQEVARLDRTAQRRLRARMQMIFQDPISSLSPRLKLSYLLTEAYRIHHVPPAEQYSPARLLEMVGLSDEQIDKYPHQISGGQARRVGIARALALHPEFIVADEPTSGLDVSVAASIINLMKDLAGEYGLTYVIISHNLNVVGYISDRTAVMYLGSLVEVGPTADLFRQPAHPYTMALLSSISEPDPTLRSQNRRLLLKGEIPSPKDPPPGCRFHTRCPFAEPACRSGVQTLAEVGPGHWVACRRWAEVSQAEWPGVESELVKE